MFIFFSFKINIYAQITYLVDNYFITEHDFKELVNWDAFGINTVLLWYLTELFETVMN